MVININNPEAPEFVQYINNRDFNGNSAFGQAGDLGPEGLRWVKRKHSPINTPLLVVANEVSSSTIYKVTRVVQSKND